MRNKCSHPCMHIFPRFPLGVIYYASGIASVSHACHCNAVGTMVKPNVFPQKSPGKGHSPLISLALNVLLWKHPSHSCFWHPHVYRLPQSKAEIIGDNSAYMTCVIRKENVSKESKLVMCIPIMEETVVQPGKMSRNAHNYYCLKRLILKSVQFFP